MEMEEQVERHEMFVAGATREQKREDFKEGGLQRLEFKK